MLIILSIDNYINWNKNYVDYIFYMQIYILYSLK